jgi:hypothetical protein
MNEQNQCNDDAKIFLAIIGCALGAAIAYALLMIFLVLASMLAVAGIAGAGYLGYRLANDKALWQLRKAEEAVRIEEEKALHLRAVPTHMRGKVENFFDDEQDKAYEREDVLGTVTKRVRNVREMFR